MTAPLLLALTLATQASAAIVHRPAEHGSDHLPVTIGPEYIDFVTQLQAKQGRKPDFEYRQNLLKGVRVSVSIDRNRAPGGHTSALIVVRGQKDKKRAVSLARAVIEAEDWADVGRELAKATQTVAEHLSAVRKNLTFIDWHVSPGIVTADLVWVERQLGRDLEGAEAALYLVRSPRAAKPAPTGR